MHHLDELDGLATLALINGWVGAALEILRNGHALGCLHLREDSMVMVCLQHHDNRIVDCLECQADHAIQRHMRGTRLTCSVCEGGTLAAAEYTWVHEGPFTIAVGQENEITVSEATLWLPLCRPHHSLYSRDVGTFQVRMSARN